MQIIKPILIACFLLVLLSAFRHRGRAGLRAGSRLLALALGAAAIVTVADPDIPQALAERVGVARGTDLILYIFVVVFALTTLGLYFQVRESNVRLQMLARRVALSDAVRELRDDSALSLPTSLPVPTAELFVNQTDQVEKPDEVGGQG